ncbi:MAG: hypothetical protein IGR93_01615 [Hydrococcus sp. C42_A2020_068]|nr:hypothetical protein [Pleurocapsa sp. PCC 7327]MBF2018826.1 hypothetical protein [Hydrococcus sp. C42_A2020_068]
MPIDLTGYRLGMVLNPDDYLIKPFTRNQLLEAIAKNCQNSVNRANN